MPRKCKPRSEKLRTKTINENYKDKNAIKTAIQDYAATETSIRIFMYYIKTVRTIYLLCKTKQTPDISTGMYHFNTSKPK